MKKVLEKSLLFLHKKYGLTPDVLTYSRMLAAPWMALLVSRAITEKSGSFIIFTLVIYILVVSTDFLDGMLARAMELPEQDYAWGGMLDRLSDKILIILMLIPFGLNLLTISIIAGESLLIYNVMTSPPGKKQAKTSGKLKMLFQAFLIPILIISRTASIIPEMLLYIYFIVTIGLTFFSVYSHFAND